MPTDHSSVERSAAITNFFVGGRSFTDTLQTVADLSVRAVPVAAFAGITTLIEGRPKTVAHTHPTALIVDQVQYDSGEGPCLDAFNDGEIYRVVDTATPGRWSEFRQACSRHGIKSTMSLPLVAEDTCYGALNLYSRHADIFGPEEIRVGQEFVAQLSIVVANSYAYTTAHALSEHLTEAMRNRAEIEQAKGIIIAATGCTVDQAFERLVSQSQRENRKLRDVAAELVKHATRHVTPPARSTTEPHAVTSQIVRPEVGNMDAGQRHEFWWASLSEFRRADALAVGGALPPWMIASLQACDIVTVDGMLKAKLMTTALADFLEEKRASS